MLMLVGHNKEEKHAVLQLIDDSSSFIIYEGERKVTKIIQRPMQCIRGGLVHHKRPIQNEARF